MYICIHEYSHILHSLCTQAHSHICVYSLACVMYIVCMYTIMHISRLHISKREYGHTSMLCAYSHIRSVLVYFIFRLQMNDGSAVNMWTGTFMYIR